jgi:hypothetical protein
MNSTNLACNDDMTGYGLAGGIALLTIISEILPLVKKIPYNGLLHIFTSQCFKKKKEPLKIISTLDGGTLLLILSTGIPSRTS